MAFQGTFIFLIKDKFLYATGTNTYGQLGNNNTTDIYTFTRITDKKWLAVEGGVNHSLAIDENNKLYSTGLNTNGQLGLGDNNNRNEFTLVDDTKKWIAIACGGYHSLAIDENNKLYSTGLNTNGQLGLNTTTNKNTFTNYNSNDFKSVFCSRHTSYAITTEDSLFACGSNSYREVGDGSTSNAIVLKRILNEKISNFTCGSYHAVALTIDKKVYGWGRNHLGQLTGTDTTNKATPILLTNVPYDALSACSATTFLFKENNLYGVGNNTQGELGDGTRVSKKVITPLILTQPSSHYLFSKSNTAYTIENGTLKSLGTITTANASTLFKSGVEAITKEHCILVGQQVGKAKIMRMFV